MKLRGRIGVIAQEVYGADGVTWPPEARKKAKSIEDDPQYSRLCNLMVKTHLSLSHEPSLKGVPKGWILPIRNILIYWRRKIYLPHGWRPST